MTNAPRPIVATIYHRKRMLRQRHYARVATAIPRLMAWLVTKGYPGDVIELAHSEFGFQIGTLKIHVGGRFTIILNKE